MQRHESVRIAAPRPFTLATALVIAGIAAGGTARADTPQGSDPWKVVFAPYVMGASIDGTTVVRGQEAAIDLSASDIFDNLELGFMSMLVVRKRDWGVTGDVVWVALGKTTDIPPADVDPTLGLLSVSGVRRLSDWADLTFGARWNRVEGSIHFKPPIDLDVERTRDWVDPIVGIVLRTPSGKKWHATLIADVGGFGVGSDLSWQVFPSAGYDLSPKVSLEAGWRLLDVDYDSDDENDRFSYDVRYQGPVAGLAIRF